MFDGAAALQSAWRAGIKPEPLMTVSEWTDAHRMLSSKGSAEPGPWRNARTPYLKEIMDCLSPSHPATWVVFMKGGQGGAGEALWIPETSLSLAELNVRTIWGAVAAPGEEALATRDSPAGTSRSFRIVERV